MDAVKETLSIPLNKSWTNSTVTINRIDKKEPLPGNNLGLCIDSKNTTMFRWGGFGPYATTDLAEDVHIWAFEADGEGGGLWSTRKDTFENIKIASSGATTSAATEKWYWQKASGDIPKAREEFSAIGAKGNNTYDIYVYGGLDRTTATRSDIAVLSLPGFQWFSLNVTSPERMRHACALVDQSQMLVFGGLSLEWDWEDPDPWAQALSIFNLKTWGWRSDKYDADASAYDSLDTIIDWYQTGVAAEWTSYTPSGSDSDSSSSKTLAGAIAGGTIGFIVVLALLGGGYYLWRGKRKTPEGSKAVPTEELDSRVLELAHELSNDLSQVPVELPASSEKRPPMPAELVEPSR
ncbi:hypothetical protein B0T10DRAFT_554139 [Thelonectria olida]|uniref:Uncharacterized protein n=1 Tax=Thelonectria olida TaxID=1576542 RepID=A0A9P8VM29_9HYPO|nr:hypothetical protein B0T10DRAFT_554139 [Thelonectria olida]